MRTMISFQCETHEEAQAVLAAVAVIGKAPHACSKQYVEPEEIGISRERMAASVLKAQHIRRRFTVLDLVLRTRALPIFGDENRGTE